MRLVSALALAGCATAAPTVGTLRLKGVADDAEVRVDGAPVGRERKLRLKPGTHVIEVRGSAGLQTREVTLGAGDELGLTMGDGR